MPATATLREQLTTIKRDLDAARDERVSARAAYDQAAEALAASPASSRDDQPVHAARQAREALEASQDRVEALEARQVEVLGRLAHENGDRRTPARDALATDPAAPGAWLSRVCLAASPLTTEDIGSTQDLDRIFFDRLAQASALLSTPGIQVADIDTTSVKVGQLTGRMTPAVPIAELDAIPKDDVPITDTEIEPPKWPKLVTMSLEAYRDARPLRMAAIETELVRAIAEGFDAGAFHGAADSGQVGFANLPGVRDVPLAGALANLDWLANAIGELLDRSAVPQVLYMGTYTARALLLLKKGADSNEPLVPNLLQQATADLLGVPQVRVTPAIQPGHAFLADPRTLLIVRRSDVETRVFEDYGFDNAEVGLRAIARMQLVVGQPDGVVHITGLPTPPVP